MSIINVCLVINQDEKECCDLNPKCSKIKKDVRYTIWQKRCQYGKWVRKHCKRSCGLCK